MSAPRRLLIIGVDAGCPALLRRWSAAGDLPHVRGLIDSGQTRVVENPYALEAGSVWPAFHSGLPPGRQPLYDGGRAFVPEDYSVRWCAPEERAPTIWRQLSERGFDCLLIDPPCMPVDRAVRGTTIVDWAAHTPANGRTFVLDSHPAEAADEVLALVGDDPAAGLACDRLAPATVDEHRRFIATCLRRIELKGELAAHMLSHKPWDVALVASCDLHCAGLHLWHVNDRHHPRYSARLEGALGQPLRDCYRAFDRSLGAMLDAVGAETTVVLFGSHGIGPGYSGNGLLDRILLRLDCAWSDRRPARGHLDLLWRRVPANLRDRLRPLGRQFTERVWPQASAVPSEQRRFFEVRAGSATGGVRLNLAGREGRGTVDPEEADALIGYLLDELPRVRNAQTGEPLIENVILASDWYRGPHVDRLPDLLVRWSSAAPIRGARSDTIGSLTHESPDQRSGADTPDGFCVIVGPGIAARSQGSGIRSVDFAPAIAGFFDVAIAGHPGTTFRLTGLPERTQPA